MLSSHPAPHSGLQASESQLGRGRTKEDNFTFLSACCVLGPCHATACL